MKTPIKLITCGTSALFAAALGLAQTSTPSAGGQTTQPSSSATSSATQAGSAGSTQAASPGASSTMTPNTSASGTQSTATSPSTSPSSTQSGSINASGSTSGSATGSMNTSGAANSSGNFGAQTTAPAATNPSTTTPSTTPSTNFNNTTSSNVAAGQSTSATSQQTTTPSTFAGVGTSDAQVTTFVQQLDAQGPAVVQQISTQVGPLACSEDTIQNLVDALHSGKSVTITSDANGQKQSATFNASGSHLGYGEAYIALALAAQELRNAGVSTCATPEQWQAALLGGPLNTTVSTTGSTGYASASGSTQFPGIVTLHTQGQGWGQIAQSNNLQLGQVISSSNQASTSTTGQQNLSPTGYSSSEMNHGRVDTNKDEAKPEKKHHWWNRDKNKDKDENKTNDNSSTNENSTGAQPPQSNGATSSPSGATSPTTR